MIYLSSIAILLSLSLVLTTCGRRVVDLLPSQVRDRVGFYVAPLLGLACVVLITTVYGWVSPFKTVWSLSMVSVILAIGLYLERNREELFRDCLFVFCFVVVVSIPILAPAIRFNSFNPFNDSFTYLVHAQWLQEHAFSEAARASGFFPAETQVVLYQGAGHRMGASFFFGFVQSLFHLEWSYYAYGPTVGLVFALGCLAIGGVIQQVVPVSRVVCLALCTLPAFSMNGFVFGAQYGFFPQSFGLAFSAGLACLVPGLVTYVLSSRPSWAAQFRHLVPLSLCCAALLITYNDMFPLVGAGIGLFLLLVCSFYWGQKNLILGSALIFTVQVLAVVNIEGIRIIRNFLNTLLSAASGSVHFGWPVLWSPIQFVAHSFGMKSPFDANVFWVDSLVSMWLFPVVLIGVIFILLRVLRTTPKNLTVLLLICINLIFWLAFLKFRYATVGLDGQVGNTFLQFKLAKWLAPFNLALLGISIAWVLVSAEGYRRICKYLFLSAFVAGMGIHYFIVAQMFTLQFQDETMQRQSPFNVFLDLRSRVASIPKDEVIYLGIPTEHHKVSQMVAYVLFDRKLAGKYEDGYLRGSLPENERDMPIEAADWMIQFKPTRAAGEDALDRIGPFLMRRAPFSFYNLESVTGSHGTEVGDGKTWNWVKEVIEYRFKHVGKTPKTKVKFQYLLSGDPRILFVELSTYSGKKIAEFKIPMKGGWGDYESPAIETNSEDVVVRISADGVPSRLSAGDPRETKFLIQNISFGYTPIDSLNDDAKLPGTVESYKERSEHRLRILKEALGG
jgi:hypothetical protein